MGQREDVVRKRLEKQAELERQRSEEAEREQAQQYANLLARHANMFVEFNEQEARIATLLRNGDWSKTAVLKTFMCGKDHWWSRQRTQELACLRFGNSFGLLYLHLWMRSDGRLYVSDDGGVLKRPLDHFAPDSDMQQLSHQLLNMRSVLNDLNKYDGPKKRLP